jgi:polar amino acid transport system permease protein
MDFSVAWQYRVVILHGLSVTLLLSFLAIICGTVFGILSGVILTSRIPFLKPVFRVYVELFRGSPLLMQLFMVFFGFPYIGIQISLFEATLLVFTLYGGAYIAEITRSGIESIPKGQWEAAESIGLTYYQTMKHVILPQTLKVSLPPLVGFYIGLIKDTSIASIIGYMEMVKEAQSIINTTSKPFEIYIVISAFYFAICFPLSKFVDWMERRNVRA